MIQDSAEEPGSSVQNPTKQSGGYTHEIKSDHSTHQVNHQERRPTPTPRTPKTPIPNKWRIYKKTQDRHTAFYTPCGGEGGRGLLCPQAATATNSIPICIYRPLLPPLNATTPPPPALKPDRGKSTRHPVATIPSVLSTTTTAIAAVSPTA